MNFDNGFFDMTPAEMRQEIAAAEERIANLKGRLDRHERSCQHSWGNVKYDPICRPGYQIQGDPVGTMGIDRQLPQWVPPSTTKQWTRTCLRCGKTETTQQTRKEIIPGNIPGTSAEAEVPNCGDHPRWTDKAPYDPWDKN